MVKLAAITVKAETPGEVDGSAVALTVRIRNDGPSPLQVDSAVVTVTASDGTFAVGTTAGTNVPLAGTIAPGASVEGQYVFMLKDAAGRDVSVSVNYAAGEPVAVFTGTVS
ncbi:hypothetical protein [Microbacterium gorillae]|uniref:hypothetical protein n=1 Tax=Microbacterium gorillae TaxID=1231063 RepID=UPI000A4FB4D2|nr:hypothetical protein [Microbacterium gorillae]